MIERLLYLATLAWGACPDDQWILRPGTSLCYRVFERQDVSWNTAQSECNKYGADLVSYESDQEMAWVYNQMNWNQNSGSWRYYWNGLNDLHVPGDLRWVTSYPDEEVSYKFNNFNDKIADMDPSRRCTYSLFSNNLPQDYGHEGKWYKEKCEKTKGLDYVCKIDEKNVKRKCPSGYDAVQMGYNDETCLKFFGSSREWISAINDCHDREGAALVHITNDQEQADFDAWHADAIKKYYESHGDKKHDGTWIGLSDIYSDPRDPQMEWYHEGAPSYTNWIFGQPETCQSTYPMHTCGFIDPGLIDSSPNWSADQCRQKKQYVCQKTTFSQCPDGWYLAPNESGGKCMQFYLGGSAHSSWYESFQACQSMGAEMLMIEDDMEQQYIAQRFNEWSRAGVTRLWLADSDLSEQYPKPNEYCERSYHGSYTQWASSEEPRCVENANLCTYIGTNAPFANWATEYCSYPEAFGCQVQPGQMIHSIVKPVPDHHCKDTGKWDSKWVLNPSNNKCYLIGKNSINDGRYLGGNFSQAQDYCHELGTELASIHSAEENSWLIPKLIGDVWIGMGATFPKR